MDIRIKELNNLISAFSNKDYFSYTNNQYPLMTLNHTDSWPSTI